jgi:hypothetical protein
MAFTKTTKDVDRRRPFHRINSPWFKEPGAAANVITMSDGQSRSVSGADGNGYGCGCRSSADFPDMGFIGNIRVALLAFLGGVTDLGSPREVMHTLPGWVPVMAPDPKNPALPADDVNNPTQVEMEGILVRSFQTWTDAPAKQYHHWYDWNFLIDPDPGFVYLRGLGNQPPKSDDPDFVPLIDRNVMELEWDCGALAASKPGPMFDGLLTRPDGSPDKDDEEWFWPMRGHFIWGTGRWIYDCGHSNPPDDKKKGLMRTEIHPVKAIASARWEAVKFDENAHHVPAIQFMFFVHRISGYKQWAVINDVDYEFIVDLPELDLPQQIDWQIGHTPEFPFNTAALRTPHLLKKVRFMEIPNLQTRGAVQPLVEPLKDDQAPPNAAPRQVKVTVPCKTLRPNIDYFGFVLSLGWHDPEGEQARQVKKVLVSLDELKIGVAEHKRHGIWSAQGGEWQARVGVNGRWMQTTIFEDIKANQKRPIEADSGKTFFEFHLAEKDELIINAHGLEFDNIGDFMRETSLDKRNIKVGDEQRIADWERDIVVKSGNAEVLKATINGIGDLLQSTKGIQNEPLGMIDPGLALVDAERSTNPLPMAAVSKLKDQTIEDDKRKLTAFVTQEIGRLAELAQNKDRIDYELHYTLNVHPQKVDG